MKKWTRWQDWVALVAGAVAALAPLWAPTERNATWTMVVLGVATVLVSLWSLAMPEATISEYIHAALGVLLFVSPWVMDFTARETLTYTAWAVGVITFIMGVWAIPEVNRRMHLTPQH